MKAPGFGSGGLRCRGRGETQRYRRRSEMVRRWIGVGFVVLCLALMLNVPAAKGQAVYGSIIGTVTDPQGGAVVGAKVTVTSVAKGNADTTTTNESGNYSVTHLIPDAYRVRIEAPG